MNSDHDPLSVFQKGVAISVWQNSSDDNLSNWTRYAYSSWPFSSWPLKYVSPIGTTQGKHKIGKSCNFWERCVNLGEGGRPSPGWPQRIIDWNTAENSLFFGVPIGMLRTLNWPIRQVAILSGSLLSGGELNLRRGRSTRKPSRGRNIPYIEKAI
jgi:hypothetical protein